MKNFIFNTDSYKHSHYLQYPPRTAYVSAYIESRWGSEEMVFFGMQAYINDYLLNKVKVMGIREAQLICEIHGEPFNAEGWANLKAMIGNGHGLPVEIYSVDEGTVMPSGNVQVQIRNLDKDFEWLPTWLEMALLRGVWYPSSVATKSRTMKTIIAKHMEKSCDNLDGLDFMLHDFGGRGATCSEAAGIGGGAHLVNFQGSDTMEAIMFLSNNYELSGIPSFSVPASEHSTMTAWGEDKEVEACRNMLKKFGDGIVSVVSDSYDIFRCTSEIWGGVLKDEVNALADRGGRLVVRPDSGDLIETPIKVLEILIDKFGHSVNSKGFKILPNHVRVLQGDGLNEQTLEKLCSEIVKRGYSMDNFVFGMGGGLLQNVTRDTYGYAMKASATRTAGEYSEWEDAYKDPVGGNKKSKKGVLALYKDADDEYVTCREDELPEGAENLLKLRYRCGKVFNQTTFDEVRERASL